MIPATQTVVTHFKVVTTIGHVGEEKYLASIKCCLVDHRQRHSSLDQLLSYQWAGVRHTSRQLLKL